MTSAERTVSEENERRLIEGLQRDDAATLASIYDAYAGVAYGLAVRTLGLAGDAEDVVQESFLALWRQAGRLDPARGIRSYLLTIVHNKAIDRMRQRGRRSEAALDPAAPIAAKSGDPEESVERLSEQALVRAALKNLPEEQRRTVELTYFNGLTINEVATRMSVPIGTVKSRLRLALGHLRRWLVESG